MFGRSKRRRAHQLQQVGDLTEMVASGKPVLLDFYQYGCAPCKVMDGIVDEIAHEFRDSAHVVKVNVARVPQVAREFAIRSTPTFVLLATSERARRKATDGGPPAATQRWRTSGLVKKDMLARVLTSNGAQPTGE